MHAPRPLLPGLIWILLVMSPAPVQAESISIMVVVGHDDPREHMDRAVLARIYRRQTRLSRTRKPISPVNLPASHPLRRAFSKSLFGRWPKEMSGFWTRSYFQGISPPYVLQSQEAVLRFVSHTPGAIGYVAECRIDGRVKTLLRIAAAIPDAENSRKKICLTDNH